MGRRIACPTRGLKMDSMRILAPLLFTLAVRAQTLDGVVDIHAHCDPDSMPRSIDAIDLAKLARPWHALPGPQESL